MGEEKEWTPVGDIKGIVQDARRAYENGRIRSKDSRRRNLEGIIRMITVHREAIKAALTQDLRQSSFLADVAELTGVIKEAQDALANLDHWMAPDSRAIPLLHQPSSAYYEAEPLGVVLIIAPWNYPVRLVLFPLIGALAAGNCAVIKPSEVTSSTASLLQELIPRFLDLDVVKVVHGGVPQTTEALKHKFDHIFYTGNGMVGKIVLRAAAEHLTPTTLELGGKSPCFVDKTANLDVAASRIVWGKFSNCGQTCVAPDYILVEKSVKGALVAKLRQRITEFYGEDPQKSADLSRIVSTRHTQRLQHLLQGQTIIVGGKVEEQDCYVAPTLIDEPRLDSNVMKEEIFGPILPIIGIDSIQDGIKIVQARSKPLALYIFSASKPTQATIMENISSGGVCTNDVIMHMTCPDMHFGGVGESGMGAYNGHSTFTLFSHMRPIMKRATWIDPYIRYPPYTESKKSLFLRAMQLELPRWMTRRMNVMGFWSVIPSILLLMKIVLALYVMKRFL